MSAGARTRHPGHRVQLGFAESGDGFVVSGIGFRPDGPKLLGVNRQAVRRLMSSNR